MPLDNYTNGTLHIEAVCASEIAEKVGTPAYVYSNEHLTQQYQALHASLKKVDHQICYAVKANSNLAVLALFADLGAGFDVVSGGELERVLRAGGDMSKVVFAGVGKRVDEIDFALKLNIHCFNIESESELNRLSKQAELHNTTAPISIRINPNIDAKTHPYISTGLSENKFGVPIDQAFRLYQQAAANKHLNVMGIDCHIGSQLTDTAPLIEAIDSLLEMIDKLAAQGIIIHHLDMGGGLGVTYSGEASIDLTTFGEAIYSRFKNRKLKLIVEPGRFLVANGGILLTTVETLKPGETKNFAVVDAAMNDLIRPALYQAHHAIIPVKQSSDTAPVKTWDIVGPVCETADFLAKDRDLPLVEGDLLAILSCGAYAAVQASNYNTRNRAPEVLIKGDQIHVVRKRESISHQLLLESLAK